MSSGPYGEGTGFEDFMMTEHKPLTRVKKCIRNSATSSMDDPLKTMTKTFPIPFYQVLAPATM